jgi:hypothetical protein
MDLIVHFGGLWTVLPFRNISEHSSHSTTNKGLSMNLDSSVSLVDVEITHNLEKIHKNFHSNVEFVTTGHCKTPLLLFVEAKCLR